MGTEREKHAAGGEQNLGNWLKKLGLRVAVTGRGLVRTRAFEGWV
jgi:hypothetical protein